MKGRVSKVVPTLLTSTSALWSCRKQRLLTPRESLAVQGVPIFKRGRADEDRFGVEVLALHPDKKCRLSDRNIMLMAGNGMQQIAIGSVLLFVLATTKRVGDWPQPGPRRQPSITILGSGDAKEVEVCSGEEVQED